MAGASSPEQSAKFHSVSAEMFNRYFEQNEVLALRVFGDTPAAFFGKVKQISAREAGPDVELKCGDFDSITCEFAPEYAREVESLKVGEMATIIGIPFRGTFGPSLSRCCLGRPGEEFPPGGFPEFREFEVRYYQAEIEKTTPLRDEAALAVNETTSKALRDVKQKQLDSLESTLALYGQLLRQAELERDAAAAPAKP